MINQSIDNAPKRRMMLAESYHGVPRTMVVPSVSVYHSSSPTQQKTANVVSKKEQIDIQSSIKSILSSL